MNKENIKKVSEVTGLRNQLVLHLLSNEMVIEDIVGLKVIEVTPDFIKKYNIPTPLLYRYIYSIRELKNTSLFPAKGKNEPVKIDNLIISLKAACKKAGLTVPDLEIPSLIKQRVAKIPADIPESEMTIEKIEELIKKMTQSETKKK